MYNHETLYFLCFFIGILTYIIFKKIFGKREKVVGTIEIDDQTGLARIKMTDGNLSDTKIKIVRLKVIHGVYIETREEQML